MERNIFDLTMQLGEFINYDFKDEAPHKYEGTTPLMKFESYKKATDGFDADSCKLSMDMYLNIYDYLKGFSIIPQEEAAWNSAGLRYQLSKDSSDLIFTGDTLISARTTLKQFRKIYGEGREPKECMDFLNRSHAAGNFMLSAYNESGSVNGPRGIGEAKDYSDLYLLSIYNYCTNQSLYGWMPERIVGVENSPVFKEMIDFMSIEITSHIANMTKWDHFVVNNLLMDFVTFKDGHYSIPKELWPSHFSSEVLPQKYEDFIAFWENSYHMINSRSIRIWLKKLEIYV